MMPPKNPKTVRQMVRVFEKLSFMCEDDPNLFEEVNEGFIELLDDLASMDHFGTEGQCDPRGDRCNDHDLSI